MPILHSQFLAEGKQPDGKSVQIPPGLVLAQRGPVVQIAVALADAVASELVKQGKPIPAPIAGLGLIDTGAISTCIDEAAASKLKLPVVNVVTLASASHASSKANVYPVKFQIAGLAMAVNAPSAVGAPLEFQGLLALIGRDVLQRCTLFYNGPIGAITLSI
jgi:predicted aspartyl protease